MWVAFIILAYALLGIALCGGLSGGSLSVSLLEAAAAVGCYALALRLRPARPDEPEWRRPDPAEERLRREEEGRRREEDLRRSAEWARDSRAAKSNPGICPRCHSRNTELLRPGRPSVVRMIIGDEIAGTPGMVVGGLTGRSMRDEYCCRDCGHTWKMK